MYPFFFSLFLMLLPLASAYLRKDHYILFPTSQALLALFNICLILETVSWYPEAGLVPSLSWHSTMTLHKSSAQHLTSHWPEFDTVFNRHIHGIQCILLRNSSCILFIVYIQHLELWLAFCRNIHCTHIHTSFWTNEIIKNHILRSSLWLHIFCSRFSAKFVCHFPERVTDSKILIRVSHLSVTGEWVAFMYYWDELIF